MSDGVHNRDRRELTSEAREDYSRASLRAERILAGRAHSAQELEAKLLRHHDRETVRRVLAALREMGYLDDPAFARAYARARLTRSPRSPLLVADELGRRGIDRDQARRAVEEALEEEGADELALAVQAARKKLRTTPPGLDGERLRLALLRFLCYRGFSRPVVFAAAERALAER